MNGWKPWVCSTVAVVLLSSGPPSRAQAPSRSDAVAEEIDVRVVTVDVVVTDRKGRPVVGLGPEDFVVREDGVDVAIESFRSVAPSETTEAGEAADVLDSPLTVVIYIDDALLLPSDVARVKPDLAEFVLEAVPSGAGVVLARYSDVLEVPVSYTVERDELLANLDDYISTGGGIENRRDVERAIEQYTGTVAVFSSSRVGSDPCGSWFEFVAAARQYAGAAESRMTRSVDAMALLISSLSGLPGRKAVLYVSGGLQMEPGSDLFYAFADSCPDRRSDAVALVQEYQQTSLLYGLSAHANANRVTLYPLHAVGRNGASDSAGALTTEHNLRDSLVLLGRETGGRAILNSPRPGPFLKDLASDFESYYEISYLPTSRMAATNHLVSVRLEKPGSREVRYRRTVRPKSTEERLAERLMSTLLLGIEENPLGASISVGELRAAADDRVTVPVEVTVPREGLLILDGEEAPASGVRLFLVARDDRNRGSELREFTVQPESLDAGTEEYRWIIDVDLEPAIYGLALGIRDERARRASYLRTEVEARLP